MLLPILQLDPGTPLQTVLQRARLLGVALKASEREASTGQYALRLSGDALEAEGIAGAVLHIAQDRIVRAILHTHDPHWMRRFGDPLRHAEGLDLWAWYAPRWSVERRATGAGWQLDAEFFDEATAAGLLEEPYVAEQFAKL